MSKDFEDLDFEEQFLKDPYFAIDFLHAKLENEEFIWSPYNKIIVKEILNCIELKYLLLIINLPPRLGKTTIIRYINVWIAVKYKRAFNNYYSYADNLVEGTYQTLERAFKIPEIKELLESNCKRDPKTNTFSNEFGGGFYGATTMGKVTGFGAGRKEDIDEFNGMIEIDDPHKAGDSVVKMISANDKIKNAILNRKNNWRVPIILIMQRLGKYDATAMLLKHYSDLFKDGRAYHLVMPVEENGKTISKREYPMELIEIEKKKNYDYYMTQLMQNPLDIEGKYFKDKHFEDYHQEIKEENTFTTLSFDPENTNTPIVFISAKKIGKDLKIVDYLEGELEADNFYESLRDFAKSNNSKKVYIPKSLYSKALEQELKPLKIEEIEETNNLTLSAFYSVGLVKGKIQLKDDELFNGLKEELKLFPNSEREFSTKAMVNAINIAFVSGNNRISSSI